jgi:hypothetical protein
MAWRCDDAFRLHLLSLNLFLIMESARRQKTRQHQIGCQTMRGMCSVQPNTAARGPRLRRFFHRSQFDSEFCSLSVSRRWRRENSSTIISRVMLTLKGIFMLQLAPKTRFFLHFVIIILKINQLYMRSILASTREQIIAARH